LIVVFASQKGGVGKTTAARSVASELALRGRKVRLVDAEPPRSALTWADVAAERHHAAPVTVAMSTGLHAPEQLPRLARAYTDVLVDTPPRLGETLRSALLVADLVVVPSGQSGLDAWALAETLDLVRQASELRPGLQTRAWLTRTLPRTVLGRSARDRLVESGVPVLRRELAFRIAYQEALNTGQGPTDYAPADEAAVEVRALCDERLELSRSFPRKAGKGSARKTSAKKGGRHG
jgi:chromosome partitioning protein